MPLWIAARGNITPRSKNIARKTLPRLTLKSHLIANDIQCLQPRIKTDAKYLQNWNTFYYIYCPTTLLK